MKLIKPRFKYLNMRNLLIVNIGNASEFLEFCVGVFTDLSDIYFVDLISWKRTFLRTEIEMKEKT